MNKLTDAQISAILHNRNKQLFENPQPAVPYSLFAVGEMRKNTAGQIVSGYIKTSVPRPDAIKEGVLPGKYIACLASKLADNSKGYRGSTKSSPANIFQSAQTDIFDFFRVQLQDKSYDTINEGTADEPPKIKFHVPIYGRKVELLVPTHKAMEIDKVTRRRKQWNTTRYDAATDSYIREGATKNSIVLFIPEDDLSSLEKIAIAVFKSQVMPYIIGDLQIGDVVLEPAKVTLQSEEELVTVETADEIAPTAIDEIPDGGEDEL